MFLRWHSFKKEVREGFLIFVLKANLRSLAKKIFKTALPLKHDIKAIYVDKFIRIILIKHAEEECIH